MQWFKQPFRTRSDYEYERERFAGLFRSLGEPRGMMMWRAGPSHDGTIYIAIDPRLAAEHFPRFRASEPAPKQGVHFLFGHRDEALEYLGRTR